MRRHRRRKDRQCRCAKAAKNLTAAAEHDRRYRLIISALKQELATVDQYIIEAQEKHKDIERDALWLSDGP